MEWKFNILIPKIGRMFVVRTSKGSRYGKIIKVTDFTITTENDNGQIERFERDSYFWDNVYALISEDELEEMINEGEDITDAED